MLRVPCYAATLEYAAKRPLAQTDRTLAYQALHSRPLAGLQLDLLRPCTLPFPGVDPRTSTSYVPRQPEVDCRSVPREPYARSDRTDIQLAGVFRPHHSEGRPKSVLPH